MSYQDNGAVTCLNATVLNGCSCDLESAQTFCCWSSTAYVEVLTQRMTHDFNIQGLRNKMGHICISVF